MSWYNFCSIGFSKKLGIDLLIIILLKELMWGQADIIRWDDYTAFMGFNQSANSSSLPISSLKYVCV